MAQPGFGATTKQLKQALKTTIENNESRSGSFTALQQANVVGKSMLNSQEGQAALNELDQGSQAGVK